MSGWKGKALEYLPGLKQRILAAKDRQSIWREVEREFHAAVERDDTPCAAACLKYAAWTLHPTPQAKTVVDVSEATARFLYAHADDLHRWIDRYDFMLAQDRATRVQCFPKPESGHSVLHPLASPCYGGFCRHAHHAAVRP
jgi:hypothetical protein